MKILICSILFLLASCATNVSLEGSKVRPVTSLEKEKYACEFLGVVTGSHSSGWTSGGNQESAMNETRNKVSELKGNAFMVLSSDGGNWLDNTSSFNAEVLKCAFAQK